MDSKLIDLIKKLDEEQEKIIDQANSEASEKINKAKQEAKNLVRQALDESSMSHMRPENVEPSDGSDKLAETTDPSGLDLSPELQRRQDLAVQKVLEDIRG